MFASLAWLCLSREEQGTGAWAAAVGEEDKRNGEDATVVLAGASFLL